MLECGLHFLLALLIETQWLHPGIIFLQIFSSKLEEIVRVEIF